ncbi:nucleotide sugar dehydrogenase [Propioniciclava sp.]|uniref:nucleotide sugar dehydrogenase n=1 Tax=Propioniciclava sp. TaxID=2038686 RepID=UPI00262D4B7E|nr:nucleotide sugar dehydrogenase [Propioniciclava sp.]
MTKTLVVLGQGYVGLPLAQAAVRAGWRVFGFDVNAAVVDRLNDGHSHVDDLSDDDIAAMLAAGYCATADAALIGEADVATICVPTPLGDDGAPDLRAVRASAELVGAHLKQGATVVLESTSYPGTTDGVVLPIIEAHGHAHERDFLLAFSPERVNPGFPEYGIHNTPKLVGGVSPRATDAAAAFYGSFVETVVPLSGAREAETAKLLENTYRHVNIALVNEMAILCHELGIDIWEVIRGAATKPFGFQAFRPGPGVGGHCIPIDPNYLGYEVRRSLGREFRFVGLAQEVNHAMPAYVVSRLAELLNDRSLPLRGTTVLVLGVTYKPDIADQRESPALEIGQLLLDRGVDLVFHDPFVEQWHVAGTTLDRVPDPVAAAATADAVLVLQNHRSYAMDAIVAAAKVVFDTRGVAAGSSVVRL